MKRSSQSSTQDTKTLRRLIDRMGSPVPRRREIARRALLEQGADAVDPLLALYDQERSKRTRQTKWYRCGASGLLILSAFNLVNFVRSGMTLGFWVYALVINLILLFVAACFSNVQIPTRRQSLLALGLALYDDIRTIGPLAETLQFGQDHYPGSVPSRRTAIAALTELLPRISSDQAGLLDAYQRDCLYRELRNSDVNPRFTVAILHAFAQIGDTQALTYVRRLTSLPEHVILIELQRAAWSCLSTLEALAEQERQSQTLLRATVSMPETPQEVLLRAAQGAPVTDPQQLLRTIEENATSSSN